MTPVPIPKPCPFCGCAAYVAPVDPKLDGDAWAEVRCISASCPASPSVSDGAAVAEAARGSLYYQRLAIERWNTRAVGADAAEIYTVIDGLLVFGFWVLGMFAGASMRDARPTVDVVAELNDLREQLLKLQFRAGEVCPRPPTPTTTTTPRDFG